jgi:hypothetical protein
MTRRSLHIVLLGALLATIGGAVTVGQGRTATPTPGATVWTATPADAARIARVEAGLAAVTLSSGAPIALDIAGWMQAYRVPGISVAVFDDFRVVWAKRRSTRCSRPAPSASR